MDRCVCTRCHRVNNRPAIKHHNQKQKEREIERWQSVWKNEIKWILYMSLALTLSGATLKSNHLWLEENRSLLDSQLNREIVWKSECVKQAPLWAVILRLAAAEVLNEEVHWHFPSWFHWSSNCPLYLFHHRVSIVGSPTIMEARNSPWHLRTIILQSYTNHSSLLNQVFFLKVHDRH